MKQNVNTVIWKNCDVALEASCGHNNHIQGFNSSQSDAELHKL